MNGLMALIKKLHMTRSDVFLEAATMYDCGVRLHKELSGYNYEDLICAASAM